MIKTAQFNGTSVAFRDLGLDPSYVAFCVVLDKFFHLSVSYYPQLYMRINCMTYFKELP